MRDDYMNVRKLRIVRLRMDLVTILGIKYKFSGNSWIKVQI